LHVEELKYIISMLREQLMEAVFTNPWEATWWLGDWLACEVLRWVAASGSGSSTECCTTKWKCILRFAERPDVVCQMLAMQWHAIIKVNVRKVTENRLYADIIYVHSSSVSR
jgi:hypothetical protein